MEKRIESLVPQGIQRNVDITNAPSGSMYDIQNMRPKDGGWRPVRKKAKSWFWQISQKNLIDVYIHEALPGNEFIILVRDTNNTLRLAHQRINKKGAEGDALAGSILVSYLRTFVAGEEVYDVAAMDNILMVTSNLRVTFHIYKEGEYVLNKGLDQLPDLKYHAYEGLQSYWWPLGNTYETFSGAATAYLEKRFEMEQDNYFDGDTFFVLAWKLKDGTYIKHGNPFFLSTPYSFRREYDTLHPTMRRSAKITRRSPTEYELQDALFSKIKVSIDEFDISEWSDVIDSLCIFAMPPQQSYAFTPEEPTGLGLFDLPLFDKDWWRYTSGSLMNPVITFFPVRKNPKEYFKGQLFHRVEEIKIESGEAASFDDDIDFKNIEAKETLPPDQLTHHQIIHRKSLLYNGRLHLGNIEMIMYQGHKLLVEEGDASFAKWMRPEIPDATASFEADAGLLHYEVSIDTPGKQTKVRRTVSGPRAVFNFLEPTIPYSTWHARQMLWPIISYPHPNASSMEIWAKMGAVEYRAFTLKLEPHQFYSFSFWMDESDFPEFPKIPLSYEIGMVKGRTVIPEINDRYTDPNRVQASAVQNPFYYPAINSYQIGNDDSNEIVWMAVQSAPTSEGQFGQFPLIVAGMNGIYLMDQSQGDVLYSSVRNISRVSSNSDALSIDGGVVFTTKDGLFVVQGREVVEIGHPLRYIKPFNMYATDDLSGELADETNLTKFLQGAVFGFDDLHQEVVIGNPSYAYTIRFNVRQPMFFRVSGGFDKFMVRRGKYLSLKKDGIIAYMHDFSSDDMTDDNIHAYFSTNPMRHEGNVLKKLVQSRLTGHIEVNHSFGEVIFRVFGSTLRTIRVAADQVFTEFSRIQEYKTESYGESDIEYITADNGVITADEETPTADTIYVVTEEIDGDGGSVETSMLTSRAPQSVLLLVYKFGGIVNANSVITGIDTVLDYRFMSKLK